MENANQIETKIPLITMILIGINVLVFLYIESRGSSYDTDFMLQMGASYEPLILEEHQYYRLVTHFFLHFGFEHLFNNMVSLLILGFSLEQIIGRVAYLGIYLFSGILAGIASIAYNVYITGENAVSCGASGAVYGLMGALLVLLIAGRRHTGARQIPRYLIYLAVSLYSGALDPTIDNAAHVGGFVAGIILCLIFIKGRRMEVTYES